MASKKKDEQGNTYLKMCVIETTAMNSNGKWVGKHATIDNITSQK